MKFSQRELEKKARLHGGKIGKEHGLTSTRVDYVSMAWTYEKSLNGHRTDTRANAIRDAYINGYQSGFQIGNLMRQTVTRLTGGDQ